MAIDQNPLYKVGDKIEYIFNAPLKEGLSYRHNVWYPGEITAHSTDSSTSVKFIDDNGDEKESTTYYNDFMGGYESIKLIITPEELEKRRLEWVAEHIAIAKEAYEDRVEFLNSIKFS